MRYESFTTGGNTGGWNWASGGTLDIFGNAGSASGILLEGTITNASVAAWGGSTCIEVEYKTPPKCERVY